MFVDGVFGCSVFLMCLGSAGILFVVLFVGVWSVARGLIFRVWAHTYAPGGLGTFTGPGSFNAHFHILQPERVIRSYSKFQP